MGNMFRCTLASGGALILTVTCDSNFAGQSITCTDGTTTLTQTCPSAAPYTVEFKIPNGGTWTVSSGTDSVYVTISDTATLHHIPTGSTVTPTDDIQTWLNCANIWDKSYTTISQVLNDATTLTTLIASNNAADYMARSTTWASSVVAKSSAMTKIGANDYCANKLLDNQTWLNAICNSSYFESVLKVKVPIMTSNTAPSGVVSSSGYVSASENYYPWRAFADSTYGWLDNGSNKWIQYKFTAKVRVNKIKIFTKDGTTTWTNPLTFKASNDNSTFDTLASVSPTSGNNKTNNYAITNSTKYQYYRIDINGLANASGLFLQFYGRA